MEIESLPENKVWSLYNKSMNSNAQREFSLESHLWFVFINNEADCDLDEPQKGQQS